MRGRGQVIERERRTGTFFGLRFRAYGQRRYVALGSREEGWTRERAERELAHVIADVERGLWRPAEPEPAPELLEVPTFYEFAREWYEARCGEWGRATRLDYGWQLDSHLVPHFGGYKLGQITIAEVDRYRQAKVREGKLSVTSINKTLTRLGQILEVALERELIDRNPVRVNPRNRKLRPAKPRPVWLDSAEQITALLDAASDVERSARPDRRGVGRRAIMATLALAGLRVGELCALRWRDVDLATGLVTVGDSKTAAGVRRVDLLPALRDELAAWKVTTRWPEAPDLVFPTLTGQPRERTNLRQRVFGPVVKRANERLLEAERPPLPAGLTPHKLRHTFASLLAALGEEPGYVMDQLGHTDATFTFRVYRHAMRRDEGERDRLRALVGKNTRSSEKPERLARSILRS